MIDSDSVDRSICGLAMTRKRIQLADHDKGAEDMAMIASLPETYKLYAFDPLASTTEVLTQARQPLARLRNRTLKSATFSRREIVG